MAYDDGESVRLPLDVGEARRLVGIAPGYLGNLGLSLARLAGEFVDEGDRDTTDTLGVAVMLLDRLSAVLDTDPVDLSAVSQKYARKGNSEVVVGEEDQERGTDLLGDARFHRVGTVATGRTKLSKEQLQALVADSLDLEATRQARQEARRPGTPRRFTSPRRLRHPRRGPGASR